MHLICLISHGVKKYIKWENDFRKMYEHKRRHWKDLIFVLLYRYYCIESGKPCDLVHETDNIYLKLITNDNDKIYNTRK